MLLSFSLLVLLAHYWFSGFGMTGQREFYALLYRNDWFFMDRRGKEGRILAFNAKATIPGFLEDGMRLSGLAQDFCPCRIIQKSKNGKPDSRLCLYQGKRILLLNHYLSFSVSARKIKIDLILLGETGEKSLLQALRIFQPRNVLTDWPISRLRNFQERNIHFPEILNYGETKIRKME
jgi:hypothetical protein